MWAAWLRSSGGMISGGAREIPGWVPPASYDGGLECCGGTDQIDGKHTDTRFLLGADQPIPALVDRVFFRWRHSSASLHVSRISLPQLRGARAPHLGLSGPRGPQE